MAFIYENNGNWEKRKVKGHRLHLRRKMKENNRKLKKIENSFIKRLLRISSQTFLGSFLELSLYYLSYYRILRFFLENSWRTSTSIDTIGFSCSY